MSLKYHLVERPDMKAGFASGEKLIHGQIKSCDEVSFEMVCDRIEHSSSATSGDVKNVLSSLLDVLKDELKMGHIVQLGELGRFRISVGCRGVKDEKDFSTSLFRRSKVIFTPSTVLKDAVSRVSFERLSPLKAAGMTGGQSSQSNSSSDPE